MSDKIELKAYGKINLGLDVIRKRPDGYHDLDMIMDTCSRVVLMNNGKIIREGSTVEILNDRELLELNGLELPLSLSGHR